MTTSTSKTIDRQKTTPFLLRLFYKTGSFHRTDEFTPTGRLPPHNLQIYTWPTCTLRELTSLLLSTLPTLLPKPYGGTRVAFRMVYGDTRPSAVSSPRYVSRDLGSVVIGSGERADDSDEEMANGDSGVKNALKRLDGEAEKTLAQGKFVIGDYICCCILPPLPDGSVAAPPPPVNPPRGVPYNANPASRGMRENGLGGPRGDYGYSGGRGGRGGGDFGYGGRGGRGGRYEDRRGGLGGDIPDGEWRRGEAPPGASGGREPSYRDGGRQGPYDRPRGRGRGRGGWRD